MKRDSLLPAACFALGLFLSSAAASKQPTPIVFLKAHDTRVQRILKQTAADTLAPAWRQQIKDNINAVFDFAELSRLALGAHWEKLGKEERARFIETFGGIIREKNFGSFVRYYREGKITYKEEEVEKDKAVVRAQVPLKDEQIGIDYLLHLVEGQWRVYDLVIDGASTAAGYQKQYARFLRKKPYEKLIERLNKQLASLQKKN